MTEDREQADRLYAADLLNRVAGAHFDHRDVAVLAQIIPLIREDARAALVAAALERDRYPEPPLPDTQLANGGACS